MGFFRGSKEQEFAKAYAKRGPNKVERQPIRQRFEEAKRKPSLLEAKPKAPSKNEQHWRAKLAGQGDLKAPKPTGVAQWAGSQISGALTGAGLDARHAHKLGSKIEGLLSNLTPAGNIDDFMAADSDFEKQLAILPLPGPAKDVVRKGIRAWHGSPHDFDKFELRPALRVDEYGKPFEVMPQAHFFAEDSGEALRFARDRARAEREIRGQPAGRPIARAVNLNLNNPLDLTISSANMGELPPQWMNLGGIHPRGAEEIENLVGHAPERWSDVQMMLDDPDAVNALRRFGGYDSVRLREDNGSPSWAVFDDKLVDIVSKDGKPINKPMRVYHGTTEIFDQLDPDRSNGLYYFSDSPEIARIYGHRIKEADLDFQNPMVVSRVNDPARIPELAEQARARGHDGLIIDEMNDVGGPQRQIVSFNPPEIRPYGMFR